mgnify:CR=1 FL=1
MVYRFTIISDEVDNCRREIQIDSDATFLDLHNAILKSVGYPNDQMTSFFVCEETSSGRLCGAGHFMRTILKTAA